MLQGLALNLGVLEGLFPSVVHSLSADVAIKTFKGLDDLMEEIKNAPPSPSRALNIPLDEYSPVSLLKFDKRNYYLIIRIYTYLQRFCSLVRRIYELVDKHLLHYAASVVKADAWHLLSERQQTRIHEGAFLRQLEDVKEQLVSVPLSAGLFVELRQPKAPPPRFSSHNRSYKRSASAGVQFSHEVPPLERSRSIER